MWRRAKNRKIRSVSMEKQGINRRLSNNNIISHVFVPFVDFATGSKTFHVYLISRWTLGEHGNNQQTDDSFLSAKGGKQMFWN